MDCEICIECKSNNIRTITSPTVLTITCLRCDCTYSLDLHNNEIFPARFYGTRYVNGLYYVRKQYNER